MSCTLLDKEEKSSASAPTNPLSQVNASDTAVEKTSHISTVDALLPYLRRADELEHGLAAFFVIKFVLERLHQLNVDENETPDVSALLLEQLDRAERLLPYVNKSLGRQDYIRFCLAVFQKARDEEKAGNPNAFHFLVSGLLLDTLEQFGPLTEDMRLKRRYSQWRANHLNSKVEKGANTDTLATLVEKYEAGKGLNVSVTGPDDSASQDARRCIAPLDWTTEATKNIIHIARHNAECGLQALNMNDIGSAVQYLSTALELLYEKQEDGCREMTRVKTSLEDSMD